MHSLFETLISAEAKAQDSSYSLSLQLNSLSVQRQLETLGAERAGLEDMLKEMKRKVLVVVLVLWFINVCSHFMSLQYITDHRCCGSSLVVEPNLLWFTFRGSALFLFLLPFFGLCFTCRTLDKWKFIDASNNFFDRITAYQYAF